MIYVKEKGSMEERDDLVTRVPQTSLAAGGGTSRSTDENAPAPLSTEDAQAMTPPLSVRNPWAEGDSVPVFAVDRGVASLEIPAEVFEDSDPLWRCFVVGYFIGDSPHVRSIHATVNRICSLPGSKSKIDVQFIDKNTVLFRIENEALRNQVIKRKCWHIADIPLVVNEWSPETAAAPPDLSAMPLWVDLRKVPSQLFSHCGLKVVSTPVGKFVKLHPQTEKCTQLDMARLLMEVDLHKPLVEEIQFLDRSGELIKVKVMYPWLPDRCSLCSKWWHKTKDCQSKEVRILRNSTSRGYGLEVAASTDREVEKDGVQEEALNPAMVAQTLLSELEATKPYPENIVEGNAMENHEQVLGKELQTLDGGIITIEDRDESKSDWVDAPKSTRSSPQAKLDRGVVAVSSPPRPTAVMTVEDGIVISPSRFQPFVDDVEEENEEQEEYEEVLKEGEIKNARIETKRRGGAQNKSSKKVARFQGGRGKDMKAQVLKGHHKKSSVRKI